MLSSREMEIAVLKDAVKILKRVARRDKCQETQEAVNVIEVVIGDLEIIAWFETGRPALHRPATTPEREKGSETMSTPKHTPGPWRLQVNRVKDYASVFPIQVCIEESPLSDETIANATLIAAAPAMYEALLNLVICPAFNSQVFERDKESHKAWTLARAALAQAEGK